MKPNKEPLIGLPHLNWYTHDELSFLRSLTASAVEGKMPVCGGTFKRPLTRGDRLVALRRYVALLERGQRIFDATVDEGIVLTTARVLLDEASKGEIIK